MGAQDGPGLRDDQGAVVRLAPLRVRRERDFRTEHTGYARLAAGPGYLAVQFLQLRDRHRQVGGGDVDAVAACRRLRKAEYLHAGTTSVLEEAPNRGGVGGEVAGLPALGEADLEFVHLLPLEYRASLRLAHGAEDVIRLGRHALAGQLAGD